MTWLLLALVGCNDAPEQASIDLVSPSEAPVPVGVQRGWRRMDLDQLDASIRKVTGGIGWDDPQGNSELLALASTLGAADYIAGKPEDLSVSLLFLKFLEDAAADVCTELVTREGGTREEPVFLVHVEPTDTLATHREAVLQNLSEALLRFHGRAVPVDSPLLEPWTFLFESATHVSGSPEEGWRAVCVGLITHPDFYTY